MLTGIIGLKIVMLIGLGFWLLIASLNNIIDPETNTFFISDMMTMEKLKADPSVMGNSLFQRSVDNKGLAAKLLTLIAAVQCITAIALIASGVLFFSSLFSSERIYAISLVVSNLSLCGFCSIWLFFLCGGLWFAYWIKFPFAQTTHFILLMTGLLTSILINL
jgi:predicted small integral membrane protein